MILLITHIVKKNFAYDCVELAAFAVFLFLNKIFQKNILLSLVF